MHLFDGGFVLPSGSRPAGSDEVAAYEALRAENSIHSALVIGYEGEPVYRGNNAYLLAQAAERPWIRPLVFAGAASGAVDVEDAMAKGAYGVSVYATDVNAMPQVSGLLRRIAPALVERRGLLSFNVVPAAYAVVRELCERFPEQRVLLSHLGLPAAGARTPNDVASAFDVLGRLTQAPNVFVKASGFYALAGLVTASDALAIVLDAFGVDRVVWGSDFSPVLAQQSFAEALDAVRSAELPGGASDAIMGNTLAALLDQVEH